MKRNVITFVTAGVLLLIFVLMLFVFQVRQTEVAVVTTFGKYSHSVTNAGFNLRLPWPIQNVYKFDNRIRNFERKFEQTTTSDAINILITVFTGWRIEDPKAFLESFNGEIEKAEETLEPLVRNEKNGVISRHPFSDLVSTNQAEIKFAQIEREMLEAIRPKARSLGIQIEFLGIRQLGLPETITTAVFERMRAERQTRVKQFQTFGEQQAQIIRSQANSEANEIIENARATALRIVGKADAEAARYYRVFQQNPAFAKFLFQINGLEQSLTNRTQLILDSKSWPFNLLQPEAAPASVQASQ